MKVFLDFGRHFIDIETCDMRGDGRTPLLQFCAGFGNGYHKDGIAFLLQRGANVYAVDSYGNSCLHLALHGARGPFRFDKEFEALVLLVKAGANVHAKNHLGHSLSELAYLRPSVHHDGDFGSYWGDFWDSILAACGYQVSDFRQQHPRTGRYTKDYPRKIFEKLWEGRQHLCPYWDEDEAAYQMEICSEESSSSASNPCEEDEGTDFELDDSGSESE